jgi:hypothetical protein
MLDLSNPHSEHIFAASREMDRILMVAHKMTVASSEKRRILFELTKAPIDSLLELNQKHFGNSESIRGRIAMLAKSLLTLRNLNDGQIIVDLSDGFGDCPYCSSPITRFQPQYKPKHDDPWLIYCPECSDMYIKPLEKLSLCGVGFGTEAI